MTDTGIVTDKLNIGYGSDIIKDICLRAEPGKIVTLIGPNGCGKTTLLKTLTGELKERGGVVYLNGEDRSALKASEIAKHLSTVTTQRIRPEYMTCREVVEIGRYPYTGSLGILSEDDRIKVDDAIRWAGIEGFSEDLFDNVSDGQKQRVLIARAVCQEPEILILDEPTSYLDIRHKIDILQKVTAFAREKKAAVIMSVHELEIAANISDTVVALGDGKVLRIGTGEEVFTGDFIRKLYHIEGMDTSLLGKMPWKEEISKAPSFTSRGKAKAIMIQGTMSNVGKSMIAAGLCRIFSDAGYKTAPFKSQNMALNSFITSEGLEMGRAQVMQAECARTAPLSAMNPILLKPTDDKGSQVIVNGRVAGNMDAALYFRRKREYMDDILKAYDSLSASNDIIVIEGAGSPVEMNLKKDDIVNMGLAEILDVPVLLVGDIDRGGIFAQILGTLELLEDSERKRVQGIIVNKFRGDRELFKEGERILKERGRVNVAGVVPYMDLILDDEDSLTGRFERRRTGGTDIAVIRLPHISNFTDMNTFEQIPGVSVRYVSEERDLGEPDMIIIPGTKNTISDLRVMKEKGLDRAVKDRVEHGTCVFGICGGFQILGRRIEDPKGAEGGGSEEGLALLPVDTVIESEKIRKNTECRITGATGILKGLEGTPSGGYEIHMGKTVPSGEVTEFTSDGTGYCSGNVYGTYIHGFFDRKEVLKGVMERISKASGKETDTGGVLDYAEFKETQYDLLAGKLKDSLDMDLIYRILGVDR